MVSKGRRSTQGHFSWSWQRFSKSIFVCLPIHLFSCLSSISYPPSVYLSFNLSTYYLSSIYHLLITYRPPSLTPLFPYLLFSSLPPTIPFFLLPFLPSLRVYVHVYAICIFIYDCEHSLGPMLGKGYLSSFPFSVSKYPIRSNAREERFVLAHIRGDKVYPGRE